MSEQATAAITSMTSGEARSTLSALEHAMTMLRVHMQTESAVGLVGTEVVLDAFNVDGTHYGGLFLIAARARALLGDLSVAFVGAMSQIVAAQHPEVAYDPEQQRDAAEEGRDITLKQQLSGGVIEIHVALGALDDLTEMINAQMDRLGNPVPTG